MRIKLHHLTLKWLKMSCFFTLMYLLTVFSVNERPASAALFTSSSFLLYFISFSHFSTFLIHSQHSVVVVFCIFGNSST